MEGQHNHYEKYITRIIQKEVQVSVGSTAIHPRFERQEFIQLICEIDGVIFDEIKIIDDIKKQNP